MEFRKGVSLIVYRKEKDKIFYLVLKRKLRWKGYELCKGGKLRSETDLQAIKRELREETGLKPVKITKLNIKEKFVYPKKHQNIFHKKGFIANCYAIEAKGKIRLSKEHSSYNWLTYQKAKNILTYNNLKAILGKANEKIK